MVADCVKSPRVGAWGLVLIGLATVLSPVEARADQALAATRHCMSCHTIERKMVGPAFKDVAKRYAGDREAVVRLSAKIRSGGSGVWGPVVMPPSPNLSEDDARRLAAWVLSMK